MLVKYLGIIIDTKRSAIIHGEKKYILRIEDFMGVQANLYEKRHGYLSEIKKAIEKYPVYRVVSAELLWTKLLPHYEARAKELEAKGIKVRRYYD